MDDLQAKKIGNILILLFFDKKEVFQYFDIPRGIKEWSIALRNYDHFDMIFCCM